MFFKKSTIDFVAKHAAAYAVATAILTPLLVLAVNFVKQKV